MIRSRMSWTDRSVGTSDPFRCHAIRTSRSYYVRYRRNMGGIVGLDCKFIPFFPVLRPTSFSNVCYLRGVRTSNGKTRRIF